MSQLADAVSFFDRHAEHYSKGYSRTSANLYDDWYSRRRLLVVLRHVGALDGLVRYADVGCGTGEVTEAVMATAGSAETAAVDLAAGMLEVFKRRAAGGIVFHQADAAETGLAGGYFDLVTSIGVLPYLCDPDKGIAEIGRLLRVGGHAVITYPIKNTPMRFFRDTRIGRFIKGRIFKSGLYCVQWTFERFAESLRANGLVLCRKDSLWPSEFCVTARKDGAAGSF